MKDNENEDEDDEGEDDEDDEDDEGEDDEDDEDDEGEDVDDEDDVWKVLVARHVGFDIPWTGLLAAQRFVPMGLSAKALRLPLSPSLASFILDIPCTPNTKQLTLNLKVAPAHPLNPQDQYVFLNCRALISLKLSFSQWAIAKISKWPRCHSRQPLFSVW